MRFSVEYLDVKTKANQHESVNLLNSFLNFHLIEKFHGWSYECLFIKLVNNAPAKKKWKLTRTYDQWANVELPVNFSQANPLEEFRIGFSQVMDAVDFVRSLDIKGPADFRHEELLSDLNNLRQHLPTSIEAYNLLLNEKPAMDSQLQVKRVDGRIKAYKDYPLPHSRRLMHARIYDHFDSDELMPYRYMYAEIFSTLLRNANISTPGYQEIYFSIDETLEGAKKELAMLTWHKYTYCALNIDEYMKATPERKEQMLLDSLIDGLRLIADFDHLDKLKIEAVIDTVRKTRCRTQLIYAAKENDTHAVTIHYEIGKDHTQKTPFYITIRNKETRKAQTKLIDNFSVAWVGHCINKVKLLKDRVEISGGGGVRGHISRDVDHMPDRYEFRFEDF
jgi:hypothetical protein